MNNTINKICLYFGVTLEQIQSKKQNKNIIYVRNFIYYILHVDEKVSISNIGKAIHRKKRTIQARIADMKHRLKYVREYKDTYEKLIVFIHNS